MSPRRLMAVSVKEVRHLLRDRQSLYQTVMLPLIMLFIFGYALSLDVDRIPTVVYDLDRTSESANFRRRLEASRYFEVLGNVSGYRQMSEDIVRGRAMIGLVIPRDFGARLKTGRPPKLQVIIDGADSSTATIALGYIEGLVGGFGQERLLKAFRRQGLTDFEPPLTVRMRVWFNPELASKNFIIPGLIAVILAIVSASSVSFTIAREWENGTMEQFIATPVRSYEIVLGKLLPYLCLGLFSMAFAVAAARLIFRVPFNGSYVLLFVFSLLFLLGTTGQGMLISIRARTQLVANQIGVVSTFLPSFLLSGFIFPIENMPPALQYVTYIVPARYFVTIIKGIFLKGVGLEALAGEALFLTGFAAMMLLLSFKSMKKRLD